jgi:hypothetical protein
MVPLARAVGKCQNQVPYTCAIGIIPADGTRGAVPKDPCMPEAEGSDLQCRKCAAPRFAAGNSEHFSALCAQSGA